MDPVSGSTPLWACLHHPSEVGDGGGGVAGGWARLASSRHSLSKESARVLHWVRSIFSTNAGPSTVLAYLRFLAERRICSPSHFAPFQDSESGGACTSEGRPLTPPSAAGVAPAAIQ